MPDVGEAALPRLPFRGPFGPGLAHHFLLDALRVRLTAYPRLKPIVLAYFVTFRCDLACSYCGYVQRAYRQLHPEVGTADAFRILEISRQGSPSLALSGGEPLIREDIVEIVRHARALGFRPISVFTNSLLLPRREAILDLVDFLQISLDTLDEDAQDRVFGRPGAGREVQDRIRHYARRQAQRGFRLNVNCVISPENVEEVPGVLEFVVRNGVRLSVCPELDERGMPVPGLLEPGTRERYKRLLDQLLAHKSSRNTLVDTRPFLQHLRDFRPMRCYPDVVPRVYPDGSVPSPCPARSVGLLNLLAVGRWKELMAKTKNGRPASCRRPCFLPCYLETSLLVRHPFALLRELRH